MSVRPIGPVRGAAPVATTGEITPAVQLALVEANVRQMQVLNAKVTSIGWQILDLQRRFDNVEVEFADADWIDRIFSYFGMSPRKKRFQIWLRKWALGSLIAKLEADRAECELELEELTATIGRQRAALRGGGSAGGGLFTQ